ncbi:MAG: DUF2339 domain-containing protein [Alistipes sp.]|nr:DUF2339 domain-containing protein [Alistipes sp.]
MNERAEEILKFEKRLLQDRMQLSHLSEGGGDCGDEMLRHKLENFNREIEYMQRQLEYLKSQTEDREAEEKTAVVVEPEKVSVTNDGARKNVWEDLQAGMQQKINENMCVPVRQKDLEKTVGRSLMGILASVLIFISLILFATLLLPYFNDTAKMITMYLLSFAFLGAGLYKLKKDRENKFYIALTGCGVGAVYISLLLGNIYFKAIGDILLYVLIGIWAVGVCLLSKSGNKIFQVIGHLGISIAIIFGCILCAGNEDAEKFLALLIFYAISSGVFYYIHYKKEFSDNLLQHVFNAVNFIMLYEANCEIAERGLHTTTGILLVFFAVNFAAAMCQRLEKTGVSFGIFISIYATMIMQTLQFVITDRKIFGLAAYLLGMFFVVLAELKDTPKKEGKYIAQVFFLCIASSGLMLDADWYTHENIFLLVLPCFLLGFYRANSALKYMGALLFYAHISNADIADVNEWESFLQGGIAVFAAHFLIYRKKEQYSIWYKGVMHVLTLIYILYSVDLLVLRLTGNFDLSDTVTFAVLALFNIAMMKSCFGRNLKTGEKEKNTLYHLLNLLFMIMGLIRIESGYGAWLHLTVIIVTLIAFMVNSKNILDRWTNFGGIYVGVKFTILMVVILDSFHTVNYIVSVVCLLMAIANIMAGFWGKYKSLRIFGLVLSMLSIFKLIMIDISYSNTLGNALSFFASGMLCFAISLIYNRIDRKMQ